MSSFVKGTNDEVGEGGNKDSCWIVSLQKRQKRKKPVSSVSLLPERATLRQLRPTPRRSAKHRRARRANDHSLRVAENSRDLEAPLALDVHEVRVGRLHEPLQLVLACFEGRGRVEEVDVVGENLRLKN